MSMIWKWTYLIASCVRGVPTLIVLIVLIESRIIQKVYLYFDNSN